MLQQKVQKYISGSVAPSLQKRVSNPALKVLFLLKNQQMHILVIVDMSRDSPYGLLCERTTTLFYAFHEILQFLKLAKFNLRLTMCTI